MDNQCNIPESFTHNIKQVSTGLSFTCAINTSLELSCWNHLKIRPPLQFQTDITQVSSRYSHVCAVNTSNKLECWGDLNNIQLSKYDKSNVY